MRCETYRTPSGVAVLCRSGRRRSCACGAVATKLCDYPTGPKKTCSKPLCDAHAVTIGGGDMCQPHAGLWRRR